LPGAVGRLGRSGRVASTAGHRGDRARHGGRRVAHHHQPARSAAGRLPDRDGGAAAARWAAGVRAPRSPGRRRCDGPGRTVGDGAAGRRRGPGGGTGVADPLTLVFTAPGRVEIVPTAADEAAGTPPPPGRVAVRTLV